MIRKIVQIGNPALRHIAKELSASEILSDEIQILIDDLIETMRDANGAGLAATQIAAAHRICIIEVNKNPRYPYKPDIPLTVLINPKITFLTDERVNVYEGCLSVPNLRGKVERCPEVLIEALDRHGKVICFNSKGISAGTFQHEIDHLDGLVFTDRMKNMNSLTTIDEFEANYEEGFKLQVKDIVKTYGS